MRLVIAVAAILAMLLAAADPAPKEQVGYFLGESKMSSPEGVPYGSTLSLVKRVVRPSEGKIYEHVAVVSPRDKTREFVAVFEVRGSKFTMTEQGGTFTGEGELTGKDWEWTSWKSTSKLAGGAGTLKSVDTLTDRGLSVAKEFYGPDGKLRIVFAETLDRISKEAYDILRSKLLPD